MDRIRILDLSILLACFLASAQVHAFDLPTDVDRCNYYEKEARSGIAALQLRYGYCFLQGKGRTQDLRKAEFWMQKSAENGNVEALASLASIWVFEQQRPEKYVKALDLLKSSIAKSNANANFQLGMMYHNGFGVLKDDGFAVALYEKAAESDNATAMAVLALIDYFGLYEQPVNTLQSRTWLTQLCENKRQYGIFDFRQHFLRISSDEKLVRYVLPQLKQQSVHRFVDFVSQVCPPE